MALAQKKWLTRQVSFQGVFVLLINSGGFPLDVPSGLQVVTMEVSSREGTSVGNTNHLKKNSSFGMMVFDHSDEMEDYVDDLVDDEDNLTLSFKVKGTRIFSESKIVIKVGKF